MATENKVLNTRIKLKRDTSANWESNNPTLLNGEIIIVDTAAGEVRFKIGDGSKTYTQLPFEDEGVRNLIADKSKITVETWTDSSGSTAQFLNELVINKIKDRQTYEEMVDAGKIDTNELYFIEEDDEVAVTPVLTTGEKIATITIGDDITDIYAPLDVNPDWDQHDSTAPDYVKNRPIWKERRVVCDILAEAPAVGEIVQIYSGNVSSIAKILLDPNSSNPPDCFRMILEVDLDVNGQIIHNISPLNVYAKIGGRNCLLRQAQFNIYVIDDVSTLTEEYASKFSSAGIYLEYWKVAPVIKFNNIEIYWAMHHQLIEQYIPTTIARVDNTVSLQQSTDDYGKVLAVNEDGNITTEYPPLKDWTKLPTYNQETIASGKLAVDVVIFDITTDLSTIPLGLYYDNGAHNPPEGASYYGTGVRIKEGETTLQQLIGRGPIVNINKINDETIKITFYGADLNPSVVYTFNRTDKTLETTWIDSLTRLDTIDRLKKKVDIAQGADYVGQVLAVNEDGNVEPTSIYPVVYNEEQSLTDEQKLQARVNINAAERTIKNSYVIDSSLPLEIDTHDFAMETKAVVSGTATYGTINVIDATTIQYIPTTILLGVDNVELTFDDESTYTINIIPATTISYDEKFITFTNSTAATDSDGDGEVDGMGVWSLVTDENYDENTNIVQTQDGVYGYDSINNSYSKYSFGKAMKATVNSATANKPDIAPYAQFTFTGTGVDIISLTDYDSGVIRVTVYEGNTITSGAKPLYNQFVNNYYGYKYGEMVNSNGQPLYYLDKEAGTYTTEAIDENGNPRERAIGFNVDKNADGCIYQLPVIKISALEYNTYTVKIQVSYMGTQDMWHDGAYSFWLDSVRVYNTVGIAGTDYTSNDLIGSKYLADEEYNSTYVDLKGKYSVLDDTTVADTAIIKLKLENNVYTPIVKSNKYDATQYKLCIGPGMVYAFEVGDIVDEPKCQLGIQLYTNTTDTEAQVSFIDSFDVSGQQAHSLSQAIGTPTEMYYKASIVKYGDKSYVVVKNINATAYVAINSAKLFNCNIVTQTDEASINAFIANITKIANGTAVGALLDGRLPQPETAEIGNLISVKEVDENGKVTATDVVDISAEAAMELATEMGLIDPVADEDGSIYVDENDLIYTI